MKIDINHTSVLFFSDIIRSVFLGDLKGAAAPFSVIRSAGVYGARSIFAKVSLPSESKNAFLTDLPPGKGVALTGKSAKGVVLAGEVFPRQHGLRIHA